MWDVIHHGDIVFGNDEQGCINLGYNGNFRIQTYLYLAGKSLGMVPSWTPSVKPSFNTFEELGELLRPFQRFDAQTIDEFNRFAEQEYLDTVLAGDNRTTNRFLLEPSGVTILREDEVCFEDLDPAQLYTSYLDCVVEKIPGRAPDFVQLHLILTDL